MHRQLVCHFWELHTIWRNYTRFSPLRFLSFCSTYKSCFHTNDSSSAGFRLSQRCSGCTVLVFLVIQAGAKRITTKTNKWFRGAQPHSRFALKSLSCSLDRDTVQSQGRVCFTETPQRQWLITGVSSIGWMRPCPLSDWPCGGSRSEGSVDVGRSRVSRRHVCVLQREAIGWRQSSYSECVENGRLGAASRYRYFWEDVNWENLGNWHSSGPSDYSFWTKHRGTEPNWKKRLGWGVETSSRSYDESNCHNLQLLELRRPGQKEDLHRYQEPCWKNQRKRQEKQLQWSRCIWITRC